MYQGTFARVLWKRRLVRTRTPHVEGPVVEARDVADPSARLVACPSNDRGGRRSGMQRGQGGDVHVSVCPCCLLHQRRASGASGLLDATRREG